MADTDKKTATAKKEPAVACKYTVEDFKAASFVLFGQGEHVVDGAFCGKDLNATYTVNEAKKIVKDFLEKPVK